MPPSPESLCRGVKIDLFLPHMLQDEMVIGLENVQALQHQHDEDEDDWEEGERQIWQVNFWDGGFRNVHTEHDQESILF